MPKVRQITFREWEAHRYKAIETILVCRHCDEWVLKLRPDRASAECVAENGHEWDEREQKMVIERDEEGKWVLVLVEVSEETAAKAYDGWSISAGFPIVSLFTEFGDAHGAYDVDASVARYADMCHKALEKEFPGAKISVLYEVDAQGAVSLPLQTVVTDPDGVDYQPGDYGDGGRIAGQVEDVCERVWQSWGWIVYEKDEDAR